MARRLTKNQKLQILEGYREGKSSISLSKEFSCSPNTVTRTIKTILSSQEYLELKENLARRSNSFLNDKISSKNSLNQFDYPISNSSTSLKNEIAREIFTSEEKNSDLNSSDIDKSNLELEDEDKLNKETFDIENNRKASDNSSFFQEVAPLITDFGFEERDQKVSCKPLEPGVFKSSESLYFLVDRKFEIENIYLKDLPDWNFLPEVEKERKVIPLFDNQRDAKRNFSKSQKLIKVSDPGLFITTRTHLLAKGISRLVFKDSLIVLDD